MPDGLSPFATPYAALGRQAKEQGNCEALVFPKSGQRMSFAAWHRDAGDLARGLLTLGLEPGDHIALLAENRLEWPVTQLAVAAMGGVLVPLNSHYRPADLGYVLKQSDAKAILLSREFRNSPFLEMVQALRPELPQLRHVISFDSGASDVSLYGDLLTQGRQSKAALSEVNPEAAAALLYTSGTTGFPKGALLTHKGMLANAWGTAVRLAIERQDRWTSIIPLFHCAGCIMNLLGCLQRGACYVGVPAFDPKTLFEVIDAESCTLLSGVPTSFLAMLQHPDLAAHDLTSLRSGTCGGADVAPALLDRCATNFPIPQLVQVYGQTESATLIACPDHDAPDARETAGPPLAGFEIQITDPADGAPLARGEIGQIEARGPGVMLGYYKDPAASAEAIDSRGWLKTGDLGRLTERGSLQIAGGRLRDMIIRGGENIYPVEIESLLMDQEAVTQVAVFGLPDDYYGEIVAAAVTLSRPTDAAELTAYCAERIAGFKRPSRYYRVETFPATASGKIRKAILAEEAVRGALEILP